MHHWISEMKPSSRYKGYASTKKSLKMPNRRTDNAMAKRKMTKGHTTTYKALHIQLMIE